MGLFSKIFDKKPQVSASTQEAAPAVKGILLRMGYWRSSLEPEWPDPAWFVEENWDPEEKKMVLRHLEACHSMPYAMAGLSWCRFCCGETPPGASEISDGYYVIPSGFVHYVEMHNVKPPKEFMDRVRAGKIDQLPHKYSFSKEWWMVQRGAHPEKSSYLEPDKVVQLVLQPLASDLPLTERLKYLRTFPAVALKNLGEIKGKLEKGEEMVAHENIKRSNILKKEKEILAMGFVWREEKSKYLNEG